LVKDVLLSNIKYTVEKLVAQKFFDRLKPLEDNAVGAGKLIEVL
jgi:hypothetical protein